MFYKVWIEDVIRCINALWLASISEIHILKMSYLDNILFMFQLMTFSIFCDLMNFLCFSWWLFPDSFISITLDVSVNVFIFILWPHELFLFQWMTLPLFCELMNFLCFSEYLFPYSVTSWTLYVSVDDFSLIPWPHEVFMFQWMTFPIFCVTSWTLYVSVNDFSHIMTCS